MSYRSFKLFPHINKNKIILFKAKKTSGMEEDQVEESLKTLELNGLVGRRGDLYYTTTKGSI